MYKNVGRPIPECVLLSIARDVSPNSIGVRLASVGTGIPRVRVASGLNHIADRKTPHLSSGAIDHQHGSPAEITGANQGECQASSINLRRSGVEIVAPVPIFEQITPKGDMKMEVRHGGGGSCSGAAYCILRRVAFTSAATRARTLVDSVPCATG
jgi:hypothetical protein